MVRMGFLCCISNESHRNPSPVLRLLTPGGEDRAITATGTDFR